MHDNDAGLVPAFNIIASKSLVDVKFSRFPVFTVDIGDHMYILRVRHNDHDIVFNGMVSSYENRGQFYSCVMDVFSKLTGIPEIELHS